MQEFLNNFVFTRQFIPHGHCYLWKPGLVWLHIVSDSLIALAYYAIPVMLIYFVGKRRDVPFDWIFLMFGTFIVAWALLHEKLYGSQNLNQIDFMDYISSLSNNLLVSCGVNQDFIALKLNIEPVCLDIDTAIPCGLIVNELVSNALKHAFPQARRGEIAVDFYTFVEIFFELIVRDNGVGFTGELNFQNKKSLGLRLVHSLATKQLDGTIEADGSQGA